METVATSKIAEILGAGCCYLIKEKKPEHAFRMFSEAVGDGFRGLCISTTHPADVEKKHEFGAHVTVLWLSKAEKDYAISPASLGTLRDRISSFIGGNGGRGVVLLDGLEYIITTNGFDIALKFLHDLREMMALDRARFIIPLSPATLSERELALLERHMETVDGDVESGGGKGEENRG